MTAHHERNIIAAITIIIALGILYIFNQNQYAIYDSNETSKFVLLSSLGLGLLLVVFYMVTNRADQHKAKSSAPRKSSSKKKKR